MSEGRGVICLKIAELLQKPRDLDYDPEDVLIRWMVMHAKTFHGLIILNNWIESLFL